MIDFTSLPTTRKAYGGANGGKIAVVYKGEQYMLKFPPHTKLSREILEDFTNTKEKVSQNAV